MPDRGTDIVKLGAVTVQSPTSNLYALGAESDFGSGRNVTTTVATVLLDGNLLASSRTDDREMILAVQVRANDRLKAAAAVNALLVEVDNDAWTATWTPPSGLAMTLRCKRAQVEQHWDMVDSDNGAVDLKLTFAADPFWQTPTPTTVPAVTLTNRTAVLPKVKGTARAPLTLRLSIPSAPGGDVYDVLVASYGGMRAGFTPLVFNGGSTSEAAGSGGLTQDGGADITLSAVNYEPGDYYVLVRARGNVGGRINAKTVETLAAGNTFESETISVDTGSGAQQQQVWLLGVLDLPAQRVPAAATSTTFVLSITGPATVDEVYLLPVDAGVTLLQALPSSSTGPTIVTLETLPDGTVRPYAGLTDATQRSVLHMAQGFAPLLVRPGDNALFVLATPRTAPPGNVAVTGTLIERWHLERDQ